MSVGYFSTGEGMGDVLQVETDLAQHQEALDFPPIDVDPVPAIANRLWGGVASDTNHLLNWGEQITPGGSLEPVQPLRC